MRTQDTKSMFDSFMAKEEEDGTIRLTTVMTMSIDQRVFNDILLGALRGPVAHWATVSDIEWRSDNRADGHKACVTVKSSGIGHHVTRQTVVVGVGRALACTQDEAAALFLPESLRTKLMEALVHADANRLDSHDATDLLQMGLFGKIRYV